MFEKKLKDIYQDNEFGHIMGAARNFGEPCRICAKSYKSMCGGCRGMAKLVNGDILSGDPQCIFNEIGRHAPLCASNDLQPTITINGISISVERLHQYLNIIGKGKSGIVDIIDRISLYQYAISNGIKVTNEEIQTAFSSLRIELGLFSAKDTHDWLTENGLTLESVADFLEFNIAASKPLGNADRLT